MDRPIPQEVLNAESRRRWIKIGGGVVALMVVLIWLSGWMSPSVQRGRLRIGVVERGGVEAMINASGVVLPQFEEAITSPIDSRVIKVLHRTGDSLKAGEPILKLDVGAAELALEKLIDQLALRENSQAQLKATLEGRLLKLKSQTRIKALEAETNRVKFEQCQELFKAGSVSKNELDQARLAYERAKAEQQELQDEMQSTALSTRLQLEGLDLQHKTLMKEKAEATRELDRATPKSEQGGVLTFALQTEGATVRKGDVVARVADLKSYRVDASVSDVHAQRLSSGLAVEIKSGETRLRGAIQNVLPTIENGVMKLTIQLDDPKHPSLRPNLRVDANIVTGKQTNTLRLKKGVFIGESGKHEAFVVRGDVATRAVVKIGLIGADYVEILDGLLEGDEVILSDMKDYETLKEVKLK